MATAMAKRAVISISGSALRRPVGVAAPEQRRQFMSTRDTPVAARMDRQLHRFNSLPSALGALTSGDILRVVGSTGTDNNLATTADNPA